MPSQRYTIVIDSELSGAERAKAILDQIQDQAGEGVGELVLKSETREAEDAKQLILEIEELAEKPNRIQLDTNEALRKAEKLGEELDEQLAERKVKIETQTAATGSPAAKSAAGSVAADVAVFASLQDLQEQAAKNLSENPIGIDPEKLDEVKKILKEIDQLAKDRSEFNLDTDAAEAKAEKLKKRLEELGHAPKDSGDGFIGKLKRDFEDLKGEIPILGKIGDLAGILSRGPLALMAGTIGLIALNWKLATAGFKAYLAEAPKFAELDAVLAKHGSKQKEIRQNYVDIASDLQTATNIADDRWLEALTRITNFGADPRNIGIDAERLKNLTALLKGDSTRAAELYSRALKGQFEQFKELGIEIDATASKQQKLKQLGDQVALLGDGLLEARTKGTAGAVTDLANAAGDVVEGFGRLIARSVLLNGSITAIGATLKGLVSLLPDAADETEGLANKLPDLQKELGATTEEAQKLADEGIKRVAEETATGDAALTRYISRLREVARAQIAVTDAQLAADIAAVDLAVGQGEISGEEGEQKRFGLRQAATDRKDQIETNRIQTELATAQQTLAEKQQQADEAAQQLGALLQASIDIEDRLPIDDRDLPALNSRYAEVQKEITALRKTVENFRELSADQRSSGAALGLPSIVPSPVSRKQLEAEADLADREQEFEVLDSILGTEEVAELVKESQALNDQIVAQRAILAELRSSYADQSKELQAQIDSLELQLKERRVVTQLENQATDLTEQARRETQKREEARKKEEERIRSGFPQEARATAATAARFFTQSQTGDRRDGESDREFATRQFDVDSLRGRGIEAAKALRDGATLEELQSLGAAFREFIGNVDEIAKDQGRVQVQIKELTRMVERGANQIKNNR